MIRECCEGVRIFLRAYSESLNDSLSRSVIENRVCMLNLEVTRGLKVVIFQKLNSKKRGHVTTYCDVIESRRIFSLIPLHPPNDYLEVYGRILHYNLICGHQFVYGLGLILSIFS